jgi:hypothetical protein
MIDAMWRLTTLALLALLLSVYAFGQSTTVSGNITDSPDGQAWFGGTYSFVFRVSPSNPTGQYFWNGVPFSTSQTIAGALDGSANYSVSIPSNTSITPAGSTWDLTVCPLATASCFTVQSISITGATQTVSPVPPSIRINMGSPPPNTRAYTDTEMVNGALGQQYFNVTQAALRVCSTFPCGWAISSGGGGTPAGPNTSIQVNNFGAFGAGPLVATVGIKPKVTDNICYVSGSNGNDSNDGLSIGSAKLTVYSCLTTVLPGGTSTTAGNGTILISGSVSYGGPVASQGMWLMGSGDPNFASPPSGWLKFTGSPAITINCLSTNLVAAHGHVAHCGLLAGTWTSPGPYPGIWISAEAGNISLNNFQFTGFANTYIRYGIDSNNNRNGTGGSSGLELNNVSMGNGNCSGSTQTGPSIDIGSNSFWIWMRDMPVGGCPAKIFSVASSGAVRSSGVTTITTTATNDVSTNELVTIANVTDDTFNGSFKVTVVDGTHFTYTNSGPDTTSGTGQVVTARSAAINIDSGPTGSGSGLIFMDNTNLNNGNIRYAGGLNGGSVYINKVSYEGALGLLDAPVILITGVTATSDAGATAIHVSNVEVSDATTVVPGVQVDNSGNWPDLVLVNRIAAFVRGRMTVLGGTTVGPYQSTYLRQQQYGLRQGQITATGIDVARRGFSPIASLRTNIANTNPSGWTFTNGTGTITSGFTAPDGTNGAGRVVGLTGVPNTVMAFYTSTTALNLGDIYIYGVWVRSATKNGYATGGPPIEFIFNNAGFGAGDFCVTNPGTAPGPGIVLGNLAGSNQGDGQWQWYSGVCKVASNPTSPGTVFGAFLDSTHSADFYAPVVMLFPAGTISDNESFEIANNLSSFPTGVSPGAISMLRGQSFVMGTGAQFLYSMAGTPTADRTETWPDIGGIVGILSGSVVNGNCPKISVSGGVTSFVDTGSPCGGNPAAPSLSVQINNSGVFGGAPVPTAPNGVTQVFTSAAAGGVGTTPAFRLSGVAPRASTCPSNLDTILATDRTGLVTWTDASNCTVTLPQAGTGGGTNNDFTSNFVFVGCDSGAGSAVITPTTSTISFWNGGNYTSGASTLSLSKGQCAFVYSDNTNYFANVSSSNGVTSFSGDGVLANNSSSTGNVTLSLVNAPAHKYLGNNTGSATTPAYDSIANGDLPGTGATTVNGQTCTLGSTCTIPPGTITIANASTTGTTTNTLTKLTGAPSTAVVTAITDTAGVVGITTSGAGTTGSAVIQLSGSVSCVFDGATISGDYVQISSTVAGNCHDTNSPLYPAPGTGDVIGRVLTTNGAAGTYTIDLFSQEINIGGSTVTAASTLPIGTTVTGAGARGVVAMSNRLNCAAFSGADDSAKLQACLVALNAANSQAGIADGTGLTGLVWSLNPFAASSLPASGEIWLPPGDIVTSVPTVVAQGWKMKGIGGRYVVGTAGTNLKASASWPVNYSTGTITKGTAGANDVITGSGTTWNSTNTPVGCAFIGGVSPNITYGIISVIGSTTSITLAWGTDVGTGAGAATAYLVHCPVVVMGGGGSSNAGAQFGMRLENVGVDCNNLASTTCSVAILNWYGQEQTEARNFSVRNFNGVGVLLEGQAQNSGPWELGNFFPGAACSAGTLPLVVRSSAQPMYPIKELSISKGGCATAQTVAIDAQTNNTEFQDINIGNDVTGLSIGANISCTWCATAPRLTNGVHATNVRNISSSGTTLVHISNAFGTPDSITLTNLAQTGITNILIDDANSCTSTKARLGNYTTDSAGAIAFSTDKTAGCFNAFTTNIASGTAAMGTSAISSGACATVVTVSATGVATTDVITVGFNTDPTAITGYGASATGAVLTIYPYPTANNVNFKVCNSTASSITPSALTLNWKVVR